jgi:hypothetical protein
LEPEEIEEAYPYITAYSMYLKAKHLKLSMSAADFDPEMLDYIFEIYSAIEEMNSNKKGGKHGK